MKQSQKVKTSQIMFNLNKISHKHVQIIIKVQSRWRGFITRKRYRKILKMSRRKKYACFQLLTSQRTYCQQLSLIINNVFQNSYKLITLQQHQILFANIKDIYEMHFYFLQKIEIVMLNYNHHKTMISTPLINSLFDNDSYNFKNIYINYCYNYRKANTLIKEVVNSNQKFRQMLISIGFKESALNLQSYMIKPVQRLCKYKMLLNQYQSNMSSDHIDYQQMQKTVAYVEKLVMQTNKQVEQFLFDEKFKQILEDYPYLFAKDTNLQRKLIHFTDNVIVLNVLKQSQTVYRQILLFLDCVVMLPYKSTDQPLKVNLKMVRQLPDLKYFKNIIQIIDNARYCTIKFNRTLKKQQFMQIVLNKSNYKDKLYNYDFISVKILGTEKRQSFFKNYTVYIIQTQKGDMKSIIYLRFKQLLEVQNIIYDKKMFVNVSPLYRQSIRSTLKSKTIEKRKLHIQQFLERVLNNEAFKPISQIWQVLGLDQQSQSALKHSIDKEIKIILPNLQIVVVQLNSQKSKIKDLKKQISISLGFIHNSQFEIFQIRNKKYFNKRLMYDEQSALKIYQQQQSFLKSLNPLSDELQYMYSRHYYLSNQEENALYKVDFIRTELQISVIRSQLINYRLEQELLITFMCLFAMYVNIPIQDNNRISIFIKQLTNKQIYYEQVMKMLLEEEDQLVTVPFLILKIMNNCEMYQCQQFHVIIHQSCFKSIKSYIEAIEQKIIIALKRQYMYFLTESHKKIVHKIKYSELTVVEVHPQAIVLSLEMISTNLRIKTTHCYQITKLIQIYKNLESKQ